MRISDWSSDVCSSDLHTRGPLTLLPFETCFECSYFISHYDTPQTRGKHSQISAYENVGRFLRLRFSCVCGGFWVCLPGTTTPPGGAACVVLWRWLREIGRAHV